MFFNPLASKPHVTARSNPPPFYLLWRHQFFNSRGQLCLLTWAEWRDLSDHTRMSLIQSRTPEKKAKKSGTLTWKFPWKSGSTTQLPLVSSNPKILKAFQKNSHHNEAYLIPSKRKNMRQEKRKKKGGEKAKRKSQVCCALLNPKTKFCFLRMPKLRKL